MTNLNPTAILRHALPHIAAALTLMLCIRLAFWQLERADEKQQWVDQWEAATPGALVDFKDLEHFGLASGSGSFDPERHVLLDNQVRNGHPGVHVFTPFKPEGSEAIIMVNRGWQPWLRRSAEFPAFETPTAAVSIRGRVSEPPRVGLQLGAAAALDSTAWPNLMTYYDRELIAQALGADVMDRVLLLDPDHAAHLSGDSWPAVNMGPDRHTAYAVQWASIGTTVLLIWIFLTYRSVRRR